MDDKEYRALTSGISRILNEELENFFDRQNRDNKHLYELEQCFESAKKNGCNCDIDKVKILLSVLRLKNSADVKEVLSYLEQPNCGWQGHTYQYYNRCLRFDQRCRRNAYIDNSPELTEKAFADINEIFLHKEYGAITTYLFAYSIAALFCSQLKNTQNAIPYFLQIACDRNSNMYNLVHEIVHICDVNTGLFENCTLDYDYRECDHDHLTLIPTSAADKTLDSLLYYRDIPLIVEGYENEKHYIALLREAANIPNKIKKLDFKAKFKVLPIFLCPEIKSQIRNVLSIDLTNLEITDEYVDLILNNKQRLGSWVYELVRDAKTYFDKGNASGYSLDTDKENVEKIIESRKSEDEVSLLYGFDDYINRFHKRERKNLTSKDITNIGSLMYFFSHYMKVFRRSVQLSEGTQFFYKNELRTHSPSKIIGEINEEAIKLLFKLHDDFAPTQLGAVNINVESSDLINTNVVKKRGKKYAENIVKYYRSYGVSIGLLQDAVYKENRYIFYIKLLPGTDIKLICRYAEEVKRLLGMEVFIPDVASTPMKIIVSEKPLEDNSLIKILENPKFKESKMEIPYAVGYDITGEMVLADVAKFPHLIVGGASGYGKSSALHSLLMSIVYSQPAEKVKLLLFDFGASGLKMFNKTPHRLCNAIEENEIEEGRKWILWLQKEMVRRLNWKNSVDERTFAKESQRLPYIVCVIDEFTAFINQLTEGRGNKESHKIIEDLLARARKVKIHLILAAQDTTKGGITIKNTNLAAGIAFRCTNWHTSKAIIGESYAVDLSGKGSMYFKYEDGLERLQGSFMLPVEIEDELDKMEFFHDTKYDEIKFELSATSESVSAHTTVSTAVVDNIDKGVLVEIVKLIVDEKMDKISNRDLKRHFRRSYDVAERYMRRLQDLGVISKLRPGTKLPRMVDLDKANEYLQSIEQKHGVQEQILSETNSPNDTEEEQTSTEDNADETRTAQKQQKESNSNNKTSSAESKRIAKNLSKEIKKHGSPFKRPKSAAH